MSPDVDSQTSEENVAMPAPRFYQTWFTNQFGHRRALWRIGLFMLITFVLWKGISWCIGFIPFPDEGDAFLTWKGLGIRSGITLAVIIAALISLRWLDRRPIALLGLGLSSGWKRDLFLGVFLGMAALSLVLFCLWAGGWASVSLNGLTVALLGGIAKAMLMFFSAALLEELLLRGYPLQAFIEGSRAWIAIIVLSCIFSAAHLNNPDVGVQSALNIFLAGVLMSVCYLKTRSLWLPTGIHLGWNWMQASFWGMGVSGYHTKWSVFAAEAHGADWISGGKFGAEASIFATVVVAAAAYLIWKTDRFGVAQELGTAWSAFPQGYKLPPADAVRNGTESA